VTPEVIAEYSAPYRENAGQMIKVLQAMAGAAEPEALVPHLPSIHTRVLLLVGTSPKSLAPEKIEVLRTGLPNFTLQRVENAGQFVHEEQPAAVLDAILRVLET
jgi:pimeloyl-ACP methyl ester carboxylesterase